MDTIKQVLWVVFALIAAGILLYFITQSIQQPTVNIPVEFAP